MKNFKIYVPSTSDREEFWIELEAQNFADAIDVILYIEG